MKYDYVITLQRPNYRAVDMVSQLLLVLFLIFFMRYAWASNWFQTWPVILLIPLLIVVLWIFNLTKPKHTIVYYRLPLVTAGLGWLMIPGGWQWLALVYGFLSVAEQQVKFPDEIGFSAEKIVRSSFPRKTYRWIDIDTVMIRDNLFTLDLRNNKLIQRELETRVSKTLQNEFNEYCLKQLHFTVEQPNQPS
jgi:hypothetical protein